MKIELTPVEAMAVYDVMTETLRTEACSDEFINAYNKVRSAIIDNAANINTFEKWYTLQQSKIDELGTGVNVSYDPV
jgi:hypothetical protein